MLWLVLQFILLALVIIVAGSYLARFADAIGELTGLGGSLAGFVLLAAAALRMGAFNLAIGNIFGGNSFNMAIFVVLDFFSPEPLLRAPSLTLRVTILPVARSIAS
jgi:cation:H+ antiporter